MTDKQLGELEENIKATLSAHLDYLDLGNPLVPEIKDMLWNDLLEVFNAFLEKVYGSQD